MTAGPKILFVAMHNSPHAARWIEMAADLGYDFHLFPVESGPATASAAITIARGQFDAAGAIRSWQSLQSPGRGLSAGMEDGREAPCSGYF